MENLPRGVTIQQRPDGAIISWENKKIFKQKFLILTLMLVWFVLLGASLVSLYLLITEITVQAPLPEIMQLVFANFIVWFMNIILLVTLFQIWFGRESIIISNTHLTYASEGLIFSKKSLEKSDVLMLSFERYFGDADSNGEAQLTLNLFWRGKYIGQRRIIIAYWMQNADKYQLFKVLEKTIKQRQPNIRIRENIT